MFNFYHFAQLYMLKTLVTNLITFLTAFYALFQGFTIYLFKY